MKCLVLSWGPEACQLSLIKSSILLINHCSCVFRSPFVYLQPFFATYALKLKDYHLTLILIRYLGCFVPVLCHFAVWENRKRFSSIKTIKQEHQHRQGKPEYLFYWRDFPQGLRPLRRYVEDCTEEAETARMYIMRP